MMNYELQKAIVAELRKAFPDIPIYTGEPDMDEHERKTHFQGFAHIEWKKIETYIRNYGFIPEGETMRAEFLPPLYDLLAECAYDLALYIANQTDSALREHVIDFYETPPNVPEIVQNIPDLTQWPPIE